MLAGVLADCVIAGRSTGAAPCADAVALWLGLHGLAHQRAVSRAFPWPADFVRRCVAPLSHTAPTRARTRPNDALEHGSCSA
ncbi:hypothetical protein OG379_29025 [Streptomyces sp. NBC_01166]|uniref:hypothetical protein n=1 Tax=Streptomyces sp. NBC_01166 TaxID=2903755 RepID=UPI00386A207D|nr:hypothetical protein OG379_29025 [Streptomyces sp. NBC_01166]